jgi:diaminopimelate decarboxylase
VGIDVHIGSQITDLEPFEAAFRWWPNWSAPARRWPHITRLDLGGGWACLREQQHAAARPDAYGRMVAG